MHAPGNTTLASVSDFPYRLDTLAACPLALSAWSFHVTPPVWYLGPLVYHNYWPTSLLAPRKKGTDIPGARSRLGDFAMLQAPVQRVGLLPVATYKSRSLSVFLVSALEM